MKSALKSLYQSYDVFSRRFDINGEIFKTIVCVRLLCSAVQCGWGFPVSRRGTGEGTAIVPSTGAVLREVGVSWLSHGKSGVV